MTSPSCLFDGNSQPLILILPIQFDEHFIYHFVFNIVSSFEQLAKVEIEVVQ